jgi:DNA-binding HxlR family transcriptional regulator
MAPAPHMAREPRSAESPLDAALRSVGDRWTLLVVAALLEGPRRFNDLLDEVSGIAPNVLTQRLRHLEGEGLAVAQPYSRRPPRSVYELTAAGRELAGAVRFLTGWGARRSEGAEAPRHEACGTPMEARWYCPTCDRPVTEGEVELRFL